MRPQARSQRRHGGLIRVWTPPWNCRSPHFAGTRFHAITWRHPRQQASPFVNTNSTRFMRAMVWVPPECSLVATLLSLIEAPPRETHTQPTSLHRHRATWFTGTKFREPTSSTPDKRHICPTPSKSPHCTFRPSFPTTVLSHPLHSRAPPLFGRRLPMAGIRSEAYQGPGGNAAEPRLWYQLMALLVELLRGFAKGRPQQDETLATQ